MIALASNTRIFLAKGPTDMRKGFAGLYAIVENSLKLDPLSGNLFLFVNRRRDKLKVLYWDRDGLAIWYRRLEQGTFQLPVFDLDSGCFEMKADELTMLIRGVDYTNAKRRKRFSLTA